MRLLAARGRFAAFVFTVFLTASMSLAQATRPTTAPVAPPHGLRVFTAGHSFHVPIIAPLAEMAAAGHIEKHVVAGRQMIGGSTVTQHWDLPDNKNSAKAALNKGEVDVLTLSPHFLMPDDAIDKFTDLLLAHNPNGRVTVQSSWVPRDGVILGAFKNAQRDDADTAAIRANTAQFSQRVRDQVKAINDRLAAKCGRQVVFEVPVGDAVARLREKVAKGEVPGIARQSELFGDDLGHGKEAVYLLAAYCHYAVIYGQNPTGLPVPSALKKAKLGQNTEKVNRILQEIAWAAVTEDPFTGVTAVQKADAAAQDAAAGREKAR